MGTNIELSQWQALADQDPEEVFSEIYEESSRPVWTLCFRILKSEEDASDAFQGAYARLIQLVNQESQPPDGHSFLTLMLRLAGLEADRLRKKRQRCQDREVAAEMIDAPDENAPVLHDQLSQQQLKVKLGELISELPDQLRIPVVLYYIDGMPQNQIATAMGVSHSTINKRIKRALEELQPKCRRAGLKELSVALAAVVGMQALLSPPAAMAEGVVLQGALQASQGAGLGSISLSSLKPVKGTALLGGKAIIATVASLVVIVSLTLVGVLSSQSDKVINQSGKNVTSLDITAGQTSINIDNDGSLDGASETDNHHPQKVVDGKPGLKNIKTTLHVLWKESEKPVGGVALFHDGEEADTPTDGMGMLELDEGLEEGMEILLTHPEAIHWEHSVPSPIDGISTIYLEKACKISGIVAYGEGGKLAENKKVKLYFQSIFYKQDFIAETTTDSNGQYQFIVPKLGDLIIRVNDGVYIDRTEDGEKLKVNITTPGEELKAPVLFLEQGTTVYGKITTSTGVPVTGAEVYSGLSRDISTVTNVDGEYKLSPLFPGGCMVCVHSRDHLPYYMQISYDEQQVQELSPVLVDAGKLKVKVLDAETGKPVPGCRTNRINHDYHEVIASETTPGELLVWGLKKDSANTISFTAPGYGFEMMTLSFPDEEDYMEKTITLEKDYEREQIIAVCGTVYNEVGEPMQNTLVSFGLCPFLKSSTFTNNKGYFVLKHKKRDGYTFLTANSEGYQTAYIKTEKYGTSDKPEEYNLTLKPGHWIELLVQDETGKPLDKAGVTLKRWYPEFNRWDYLHGFGHTYQVSKSIMHHFADLPDGEVEVSIRLSGYSKYKEVLSVGQSHQITLKKTPLMTVMVVDKETQKPVTVYKYRLSDNKHMPFTLVFDSDGIFTIDMDVGETLPVYIYAEEYSPFMGQLKTDVIKDNEVVRFELEKPRITTITVVDHQTKTPLAELPVGFSSSSSQIFWSPSGPTNLTHVTDSAGTLSYDFAGKHALFTIPPYQDYAREIVEIKPEDRNIVVSLKKGSTITAFVSPFLEYEDLTLNIRKEQPSMCDKPISYNQQWESADINSERVGVFKNLSPGEYSIGVYGSKNDFKSSLFTKKIVIDQYGESIETTLCENVGNSRLYGKVLTNGKALFSGYGMRLTPTFQNDNNRRYFATINREGCYEHCYLEDGEYIALIQLSHSTKDGDEFINRRQKVQVQGDTEFIFDVSEKNEATVSFALNEQDQKQGYQVLQVKGVCQKDSAAVYFQQKGQQWVLTDDLSDQLLLKVTLSNGQKEKVVSLDDQLVDVDTMSHSSDLGVLSVSNTGSVTILITHGGADELNLPNNTCFITITNNKGLSRTQEFQLSETVQTQQVNFSGLPAGVYTISRPVESDDDDPARILIKDGQEVRMLFDLLDPSHPARSEHPNAFNSKHISYHPVKIIDKIQEE